MTVVEALYKIIIITFIDCDQNFETFWWVYSCAVSICIDYCL